MNGRPLTRVEKTGTLHLSRRQWRRLAVFKSYIWWKNLRETMKYPDRLIAQVMDIGTWDDICLLMDIVGDTRLRTVLKNAETGQFSPKSWHFLWYRLTDIETPPPMPKRKFM